MSLHIIGGKFQNRKLKTAKNLQLRPTMSMLREAVFNICQNYIENARFLDLFAGSGAMGMEAISRGASYAVCVEKDNQCIRVIEQNISMLQIEDQMHAIKGNVFKILKNLDGSFDIIYIDPPYELYEEQEKKIFDLLQELTDKNLLNAKASVFLEGPYTKSKLVKPYDFPAYAQMSARKVGKSILYEYQFLK